MIRKEKYPRNGAHTGDRPEQGQQPYGQQLHSQQRGNAQQAGSRADYLSSQETNRHDFGMNVDMAFDSDMSLSTNVGIVGTTIDTTTDINVDIYVAAHCIICDYSYEIADYIREQFPQVSLRLIDIEAASEPIPEAVFATPTYMLNGRVWSLGNPSPVQVSEKLQDLMETAR